jgi:hypothetical protein
MVIKGSIHEAILVLLRYRLILLRTRRVRIGLGIYLPDIGNLRKASGYFNSCSEGSTFGSY